METDQINQQSAQSPVVDPLPYINEEFLQVDKKSSYKVNNIIAAVFVGLLFFSFILPSDIFFVILIVAGIAAGISFLTRILKLIRHSHPAVKVLGIVVGIGGGIFIVIIGFFAGLIGAFRAHPMTGC